MSRGATAALLSEHAFLLHDGATTDVTELGTAPSLATDGGAMPTEFLGKAAPRDWLLKIMRGSGGTLTVGAGAYLAGLTEDADGADEWINIADFTSQITITAVGWGRPLLLAGVFKAFKFVGTLSGSTVIVSLTPIVTHED